MTCLACAAPIEETAEWCPRCWRLWLRNRAESLSAEGDIPAAVVQGLTRDARVGPLSGGAGLVPFASPAPSTGEAADTEEG